MFIFLLFVSLIPVGAMGRLGNGLTVLPIVGGLAVLIDTAGGVIHGSVFRFPRSSGLVLLLTAAALLSAGFSAFPGFSYSAALTYVELAVLFLLTVNIVKTETDLRRVIRVMALSSIVFSGLCLIGYAFPNLGIAGGVDYAGYEFEALRRATGTMDDPNSYAFLLTIVLPFLIPDLGAADQRARRTAFLGTAVISAAVLSTRSLGGLLGVVVAFGLSAFWHRDLPRRGRMWTMYGILGAGVLAGVFMFNLQDRILTQARLADSGLGHFATDRGLTWSSAVGLIQDHPVWGVGPGLVERALLPYWKERGGYERPSVVPHNSFLGQAAATGLVGFTLFALVVGSIFVRMRKSISALRAASADADLIILGRSILIALLMILSQALFLDLQREKSWFLILALAVVFSELRTDRSRALTRAFHVTWLEPDPDPVLEIPLPAGPEPAKEGDGGRT